MKASDDYETVAGWLMDEFDCVPQLGDEFAKDGFTFKVRKVRRDVVAQADTWASEGREVETNE